ncbi:MAG: hypothetical protein ACREGD_04680 [Candidatus Saccharimonadales bacterium]
MLYPRISQAELDEDDIAAIAASMYVHYLLYPITLHITDIVW